VRHTSYREKWWTRQRVLDGLRRFYRDFGCAPTSTAAYQERQQFTGSSNTGVGNPYPSSYGVLKYFASFREAWKAIGIETDRAWEAWSPEEDWFLTEGAGILSRKELAEALNRTPNAVHRRLYDLGIHTYKARGWTFHRVMRVTQVPDHIIRKYADRGELPYFRGSKCIYVDPADLLVIEEIDWEHPPAELAEAVRHSLMTRLVKILSGQDWRSGRPYQPHPKRTTSRRWSRHVKSSLPKPVEIIAGDWVQVRQKVPARPGVKGHIGYVHVVYWSGNRQKAGTARTAAEACWMARVEFKKGTARKRLNCTLPLTVLEKVSAPNELSLAV
jgi:hypothetical protein